MAETAVELAVRQIFATLDKDFAPKVDVSDLSGKSKPEVQIHARTRGLAAFVVLRIGGISIDEAAKCVIDGFDDNGVDAIYYSKIEKTLWCVQSKVRLDGNGSVDVAEISKFLNGVRDLLNGKFDRFNEKFRALQTIIDAALDDANTKLAAVIAYTGEQPIADHVGRLINDFLDEHNKMNPEFAAATVWGLKDLHTQVRDFGAPKPITLDVQLKWWGRISDPYEAYYGHVDTADVAAWWQAHGARLLDKNIRYVLEGSGVNEVISRTLEVSPEKFWYFNNGITALCTTIKKKPHGGASTDAGTFTCTDVHIVNGAQTVGSIAAAHLKHGQKTGKVAIRFISLEHVPPEFANDVTRATNTQNSIDGRDFVALDPQQERLKRQLAAMDVQYTYKSGEPTVKGADGFDIREATVALACAHPDVALTVVAKRYIGGLWEDTAKAPYTLLFNETLSALRCWRSVQIARAVDGILAQEAKQLQGRPRLISIHGNRFILHMIFNGLGVNLEHERINMRELLNQVQVDTKALLTWVIAATEKQYPDSYAGNIFKNQDRYKELEVGFDAYKKQVAQEKNKAQGDLLL